MLPAAGSELTASELDGVVGGSMMVIVEVGKAILGTLTNIAGAVMDSPIGQAINPMAQAQSMLPK